MLSVGYTHRTREDPPALGRCRSSTSTSPCRRSVCAMGRGKQVGEVGRGASKRTQGLTLRRIGFSGAGPGQPSLPSLALLLVAQELERLLRHLLAGLEPGGS